MKVALYARVSTSEEKELQDPETQLIILRDWSKLHGHEVYHQYIDYGTGKTAEGRDQFKAMVGAASQRPQPFQAVVCLRLDRFMRDVEEGMGYAKKLRKAECGLVLVKDEILGTVDTTTDIGEFFLAVVLAIGRLEARRTSERTKEGISRFKREKGYWGRGKAMKSINIDLAKELLKINGNNLTDAARKLGVARTTLRDRLKAEDVGFSTSRLCRNTPTDSAGSIDIPPTGDDIGRNTDVIRQGRRP